MHKIKKASNSNLWFVIETDEDNNERQIGSFEKLKDAKKRALERKGIVGDKRNLTIEKILYYAS